MLVKILIICGIVALIVFSLNTLFKLLVGVTTWCKFKDKLDDIDFAVKVEDEILPEDKANENR